LSRENCNPIATRKARTEKANPVNRRQLVRMPWALFLQAERVSKMMMKAITLRQPWANLIAEGKKTIETRKWRTEYRGDLVICSSKSPKIEPAGFALCVVELYTIGPMVKLHETEACCEVYPGAYAWKLRNLRLIKPIFRVVGSLSIFNLVIPEGVELVPFTYSPERR